MDKSNALVVLRAVLSRKLFNGFSVIYSSVLTIPNLIWAVIELDLPKLHKYK